MKNLYDAKISQLKRLPKDVKKFCVQNSLNQDFEFAINLVIEEIFTNICLYGYKNSSGKVDVSLQKIDGKIKIEISDEAPEFNPLLQAPKPDFTSSLEEREIGGLGLHLVKNFTDEVSYKRISNKNVLIILKNIA